MSGHSVYGYKIELDNLGITQIMMMFLTKAILKNN